MSELAAALEAVAADDRGARAAVEAAAWSKPRMGEWSWEAAIASIGELVAELVGCVDFTKFSILTNFR